tara:strand:+ start:310 stop:438 length:129 start_codon:yes stop_codon:yes gene_type:complete
MSEKDKSRRLILIALIATKQAIDYDYSTGVSVERVFELAKQL